MKQKIILMVLALAFVLMAQAQKYNRQDAVALYQKAKKYEKGKGVDKNTTLAFELYQKAAEMGLDSAQNKLGACYEDGIYIAKDHEKAVFLQVFQYENQRCSFFSKQIQLL